MNEKDWNGLRVFIQQELQAFHQFKISRLQQISLNDIIKRKNPYLFRAKHITQAQDLIVSFLDAYLSSGEETKFGEIMEKIAIFVCAKTKGGGKSSAEGVDLEFAERHTRYLVSIKSGPNWGNSQQIKRMVDNFKKAKKILGTNASAQNITAVNGCCYGTDDSYNKGDYLKLCGQRFWHFLSDDEHLYQNLIVPFGENAKQRSDELKTEYGKVVNRLTLEFLHQFCSPQGEILWDKLLEYNSGAKKNTDPLF